MPHLDGIKVEEEELHGCKVTTVHVQTEQAAKMVKRVVGSYITITTNESLNALSQIEDIGECLAEVLSQVMQPYYHGKLCICGIGNGALPADALGPETVHNLPLKLMAQIGKQGNFREVCSLVPGTSSTNNIDTEVIVKGVVQATEADCVLLVDSLVSTEPSRLYQSIQISTSGGVSPQLSGHKADWSALGVPVISLGVPVSITADTLSSQDKNNKLFTSANIQDVIVSAGQVIAYAILRMCWPSKSEIDCFVLSGLNRNPIPDIFLPDEEDETDGASLTPGAIRRRNAKRRGSKRVMQKVCPHCAGTITSELANFCAYCGNQLSSEDASMVPPEEQRRMQMPGVVKAAGCTDMFVFQFGPIGKGGSYLQKIIDLLLKNGMNIEGTDLNELLQEVCVHENVKLYSARRTIQRFIERAWKQGYQPQWAKYTGWTAQKPPNVDAAIRLILQSYVALRLQWEST